MKIKFTPFEPCYAAALVIAVLSFWTAGSGHAQQLQKGEPQEHIAISAPKIGTFYFVQRKDAPPLPFDPFFGQFPVLEIKPGLYLVDDSKVDYVAWREEQKSAVGQKNSEGMALMVFGPPGLGGGGGTNGSGGGTGSAGMAYSYSSNELWLEIALGTNVSTALITLHNTTNGVRYQLLSRPEVNIPPWLVEQTLFGAVGTNTLTTVSFNDRPLLFFQAGVDTDGDGLVDYWESVWGTNPNSTDTDGDGMNDYVEVVQGRNPNDVNGAVSDTTGLVKLQVFTPFR